MLINCGVLSCPAEEGNLGTTKIANITTIEMVKIIGLILLVIFMITGLAIFKSFVSWNLCLPSSYHSPLIPLNSVITSLPARNKGDSSWSPDARRSALISSVVKIPLGVTR